MSRLTGTFLNFYNTLELSVDLNSAAINKLNANNGNLYYGVPTVLFDGLNFNGGGTKLSLRKFFKESISLDSLFYFFFARITFRGKSYRLRSFNKSRKFIMNFGYSHWTRLWLPRTWFFGKRKKKKDRDRPRFIVVTKSHLQFKNFCLFLPYVRFYNPYTYRGLRLKKQHIIRRPGKINQHISILH